MKFRKILFLTLLACWVGTARAEGPELKFDPNEKGTEKEAKPVYGETPVAKFGNDQNYFKLGGYASMRFSSDSAQGLYDTFTLRRFVLTTDALISSKFRIYSELEFERFRKFELERTSQVQNGGITLREEIEGTHGSEIALEQIWFELAIKDYLRVRGGGVLIPVGRFNIDHDDNRWNFPRRTLVDRGVPVLPATSAWDELGIGLTGDIELGEKSKLSYQAYVVNGATLDFELENVIRTQAPARDVLEVVGDLGVSTGTFSEDIKDGKAVTARLAYSPALGHEVGFSGYFGRYTPGYLEGRNLLSLGLDWLTQWGDFAFEGEYLFTHMEDVDGLLADFSNKIGNSESKVELEDSPDLETRIRFNPARLASNKQGYWLEFRYSLRPDWLKKSWFGEHFSDPQLIPMLRVEQAFLGDLVTDYQAVSGVTTILTKENRRVDRLSAGLAFRLNPLAVFQLAYEFTNTNSGRSLASVTNDMPTLDNRNHAVLVGAAFGF